MKYIKTYEGLFRKAYELDETIKGLFNRIKEIFDFECLTECNGERTEGYIYNLEETDSKLGFIEIKILELSGESYISGSGPYTSYYYELSIDNEKIECSKRIKKQIFKFLKEKIKEKIDIEKKTKINDIKNKYSKII